MLKSRIFSKLILLIGSSLLVWGVWWFGIPRVVEGGNNPFWQLPGIQITGRPKPTINWLVATQIFLEFSPLLTWGDDPNLTNIFQIG